MKKFLFLVLIYISVFSYAQDYRKVYIDLPYGQTTLKSTFYCFNELETGRKLALELYGIKDLDALLKKGGFRKLMPFPLNSELGKWNYAIMTENHEFWFFENRDDGWLWGTGRY